MRLIEPCGKTPPEADQTNTCAALIEATITAEDFEGAGIPSVVGKLDNQRRRVRNPIWSDQPAS